MDFSVTLTLVSSAYCFLLGILLLLRLSPRYNVLLLMTLLFAMGAAMALVPLMYMAQDHAGAALLSKLSSALFSISCVVMLFIVLVYPYEFVNISTARGLRQYLLAFGSVAIISGWVTFLFSGATESVGGYWFDRDARVAIFTAAIVALPISNIILFNAYRKHSATRRPGLSMAIALNIILIFSVMSQAFGGGPENWIILNIGLLLALSVLTLTFLVFRVGAFTPTPEAFSTGSKSDYKLLQRRIYIVEETRPNFSFEIFSQILRRRCYDCANDESFVCESLDCASCTLPCPCKECTLYRSRTQGLIISRKHPNEVRKRYFIQTTPIVWLTSVPGKDNMDPAKLSLLTDMIVNFVEKSQNGVVLVEGIEYLVMANDFQRVLRAIDRWSEAVMSNASRLVVSLDSRAFDIKEIALIERNKEVVRSGEMASFEKILASSS